jgi:hypothetical protein
MKSVEQIVDYLAERIGYIYHHPQPLMYGRTAEGVNLLLWNYHETWSEVVEKRDDFQAVLRNVHDEADCQAADFPTRYLGDNPSATQEEIAGFVTAEWRTLSDRLDVPIPHERLNREFAEFRAHRSATQP